MEQTKKNRIKNKVLALLLAADIHYLPLDLDQLMYYLQIRPVSFSAARQRGLSIPEQIDGFTVIRYQKGAAQYLLVYKDDTSFERLRWTLAHEIGHIVLGHLERQTADEDKLEEEANYFARELLMPLVVLDRLQARSLADVCRVCGVSRAAAQIRLRDFERYDWYRLAHTDTEEDQLFIKIFSPMFSK